MRAYLLAFGRHPTPAALARWRHGFDPARALAAIDGNRIVGTTLSYPLQLTVPGGRALAACAVSFVSVAPGHRRQGILTELTRRQLAAARAQGEIVAILHASEAPIYRHLGFGVATWQLDAEIDRVRAGFPDDPGEGVRPLDQPAARSVLPGVFEQFRRQQPGAVSRPEAWWRASFEAAADASGETSTRFDVSFQDAGEAGPSGYLTYRTTRNWDAGIAGHVLVVEELVALTPQARRALWGYCFAHDLFASVRVLNAPVDDPLRLMLSDPRRYRVRSLRDHLWLRLLDVPAALAARGYAAEESLVLEISDRPAADLNLPLRYQLHTGSPVASCQRTDEPAQLRFSVAELSAAFLGGTSFTALAMAGRGRPGSPADIARLDRAFASFPAPWCGTDF